jgi:hypothetical protein
LVEWRRLDGEERGVDSDWVVEDFLEDENE